MKKVAVEAALRAGDILTSHLGHLKHIKEKRPADLVTEVDKLAEKTIIEIIQKSYPDHSILAEEGGSYEKKGSDYKWIIDPLDGTTNYIHALQFFCTSIALEENGQVILGICYAPALGEFFIAEKGEGAYLYCTPILQEKMQASLLSNPLKLQVSKSKELSQSFMVTGFSYEKEKSTTTELESFKNFLGKSRAVRRLGSAALDLCYVARGIFDGFWESGLAPWDTAAAQLLVTESGGTISDYKNEPFDLYKPEVVASNGLIHEDIIKTI